MKSFKIKPKFKAKMDFRIKSVVRLFMVLTMCLIMCACGNKDVKDDKTKDTHKDSFNKPGSIMDEVGIDTSVADGIEDKTVLDKQLEDNKSSSDSETVENSAGFDLSNISENAVKNLINDLATENNYTTFNIIERYEDNMINQVGYTILFNNSDYWVITYENGDAYAIKDEYGVYAEESEEVVGEDAESETVASEAEATEEIATEESETIENETEATEEATTEESDEEVHDGGETFE